MANSGHLTEFLHVQHQNSKGRVDVILQQSIESSQASCYMLTKLNNCLSELAFGSVALTENQDVVKVHFCDSDFVLLTRICSLSTKNTDCRENLLEEALGKLNLTDCPENAKTRPSTTNDSGFGEFGSIISDQSMKSMTTCSTFGSAQNLLNPSSYRVSSEISLVSTCPPSLRNCASHIAISSPQAMPERKHMSDPVLSSRRDRTGRKGGRLAASLLLRCTVDPRSRSEISCHMTKLELCLVRFQTYVKKRLALPVPLGNLVREASVKLCEELRALNQPSLPPGNFVSMSGGNKLFMQSLKRLEKLLDAKTTKFFLSTLCSAAFLHYQNWLQTISPSGLRNNHKFSRIVLFGTDHDLLNELKIFLIQLLNPKLRLVSNRRKLMRRCQTCPLVRQRVNLVLKRRMSFPVSNEQERNRERHNTKFRSIGDSIPFVRNLPRDCSDDMEHCDDERILCVKLKRENENWQSYFKDAISVGSDISECGGRVKHMTWVIADLTKYDIITLTTSPPVGSRGRLSMNRSSAMLSPLIGSAIEETSRVFDLTRSSRMACCYLNNCLLRVSDLSRMLVECLVPEPRWEIHELARNLGVHPADLPLLLGIASAYVPGIDEQFQLDFR